MKQLMTLFLVASVGLFAGCDDSTSSGPDFTGEEFTYVLSERSNSGVSGTVTFSELEGGSTLAVIELNGTPANGSHPAHIHVNTAAEGGGIAVSLEPINGSTGVSETTIEATDGGEVITYDQLLGYDGYVNVHLSASDLGTVVAQGDVGGNAFTGTDVQYVLEERNSSGVSGSVTLKERLNGTFLAVLELTGTPQGGNHPAHIHDNSASAGGPIAISLNNVNGDTGKSQTQIEAKNDETPITYGEIESYNGYVNVHLSPDDLGTVVSQGNIGSNGTDTGQSSSDGGSNPGY